MDYFWSFAVFTMAFNFCEKRGGTRLLETGQVYQQKDHRSCLVLNKQTQLRIRGIRHLLSAYPWWSGEDCYLFPMGWNTGWESCEGLGMAESSEDKQDPSVPPKARQSYAAPSSSAIDRT
jgi:hypothetical protein